MGGGCGVAHCPDHARPDSAEAVACANKHIVFVVLQLVHAELRKRDVPSCSRLIQQVSTVMMITALALVGLYFFGSGENMYEITGQPYNLNSPVIVILITAPVAMVVTLWFWLERSEPLVCQRCKMRYGNVIEHGFVGDLFLRSGAIRPVCFFPISRIIGGRLGVLSFSLCKHQSESS